ncbi:hypothetical protein [Amycolatopsis sp. NPDC059657]|uniref:hypothetical protein n=1 Tax=Amycolatopsis sp. NPDC059657 TaxID=3346899 RepID=UPI003672EB86
MNLSASQAEMSTQSLGSGLLAGLVVALVVIALVLARIMRHVLDLVKPIVAPLLSTVGVLVLATVVLAITVFSAGEAAPPPTVQNPPAPVIAAVK